MSKLQLLESHIKNELIEKSQLVRTQSNFEESLLSSLKPLNSASIACGASVFEVCLKVPAWASQVGCHSQFVFYMCVCVCVWFALISVILGLVQYL